MASGKNLGYAKPLQVVHHQEVSPVARGDGSHVPQTKILGRVDTGHLDGDHRVQSLSHGLAHHIINVALAQQVLEVAIISDEAKTASVGRGDQGQQVAQVAGCDALPDEDVHPQAQLLPGFVQGGALVIGTHTSGHVSVQVLAREARRMAVHRPLTSHADLLQHLGHAEKDAREVHHLSQAQHAGMIQQRGQVGGRELCPGRLHLSGRHTGRQHHVDRQG